MRSEALDRVELIFTLFDSNGNGYIEADDFELTAERVVEAAPRASGAAKNAMLAAYRKHWSILEAELDADRDGRVSMEEYCSCVLSPERFDDTLTDFAESLAALADPDEDGLIHRPDFVALMTAIGFEFDNINTLFDALEPTEDDQVRVLAWVESIKDYYSPDKAGIVGDHLVPTPA
ncbi:EF-hand domain-containing protein [Actinokineospora spheciospongiae]|uniref:EF-hand domain-containing protein n=1 Tax=Actinokineospora spheciospongiae TaxID=909613 RepID=UPI000D719155|nr:EF-hand domain-containing protein [Actinokineospora spheciospongiae]PWW67065.1 EF hand domain-containing protein [Actinokineospora spheciospongiae]